MRKYILRKLMLVLVLALMFTAAGFTVFGKDDKERTVKLKESLEQARLCEEEGYYRDAANYYQEALELAPENLSVKKKLAYMYLLSGEDDSFMKLAESINKKTGGDRDMYLYLAFYYQNKGEIYDALDILKTGRKQFPFNESIKQMFDEMKGLYSSRMMYADDILYFDTEILLALKDNVPVAYNSNGKCVKKADRDDVIIMDVTKIREDGKDKYLASIKDKNGICRYVDENGVLRRAPGEQYDYLGCIRDGRIPVSKNGRWAYLDERMQLVSEWYEEATAFCNGMAAVKQNGKWHIIGSENFENLSDKEYEDIVFDELRIASRAGVIAAKDEEGYVLVDKKGNEISSHYDSIQAFSGKNSNAAVSKDGKYGLINKKGEVLLECEYEELAGGNGKLIRYRKNGLWGYMDAEGEIFTDAVFEMASDMDSDGNAYVYAEGGWQEITFYYFGKEKLL